MPTAPEPFDPVPWIALLLAAVSLIWQVAAYLRAQPDVRVQSHTALSTGEDGVQHWHVVILVTNLGAQPVTITRVLWQFRRDERLFWITDLEGPAFPHRLDGSDGRTWRAERPVEPVDAPSTISARAVVTFVARKRLMDVLRRDVNSHGRTVKEASIVRDDPFGDEGGDTEIVIEGATNRERRELE